MGLVASRDEESLESGEWSRVGKNFPQDILWSLTLNILATWIRCDSDWSSTVWASRTAVRAQEWKTGSSPQTALEEEPNCVQQIWAGHGAKLSGSHNACCLIAGSTSSMTCLAAATRLTLLRELPVKVLPGVGCRFLLQKIFLDSGVETSSPVSPAW